MDDKDFGAKLKSIRTRSGKTVPEISSFLISLGYKASEKTIYIQRADTAIGAIVVQRIPAAILRECLCSTNARRASADPLARGLSLSHAPSCRTNAGAATLAGW